MSQAPAAVNMRSQSVSAPLFHVVAAWPRVLPNKWILGSVSWVAVDSQNHLWILQRPKSVPPAALGDNCCVAAPPVIEFDEQGAVVQAWGGDGVGYEWPTTEHGLAIDSKGNVWVSGSGAGDTHILRFTSTGKFLTQIGRPGQKASNNDQVNVARAADMRLDEKAGEIYVADGEGGNRRVIVFDSDTGVYKRHWGAYGEKLTDDPAPKYEPGVASPVFSSAVHCINIAADGLVYVCDRGGNRIQVFRKDGTFVKEGFVSRESLGAGTTSAIGFSPDQKFLYVADGTNNKVWILNRDSLEVVGSIGEAGAQPGQFRNLHGLATDSKGNIYTGEVTGMRAQKFALGSLIGAASRVAGRSRRELD